MVVWIFALSFFWAIQTRRLILPILTHGKITQESKGTKFHNNLRLSLVVQEKTLKTNYKDKKDKHWEDKSLNK